MAGAMVSLSESIQASIIIHNQLQQQLRHPPQQQQQQKGIGFCTQILLVSASFGIEMCVSFEQIYQILILQYLGVPVSLLSINGIACGGTSMVLLPILGFVTDRGTNPKNMKLLVARGVHFCRSFAIFLAVSHVSPSFTSIFPLLQVSMSPCLGLRFFCPVESTPKLFVMRKLMSLFVGMWMFLCGLSLLIACGFIKLASNSAIFQGNTTNNASITTPSTFTELARNITFHPTKDPFTVTSVTSQSSMNTTGSLRPELQDNSELPVTAFMSIIGFALIDIGFDMSVSLTRAFILENTPSFQHTRLLVMATAMASMAGTTFSFIGCFDFPGVLGPLFHVEGVAATLIFFCSLLICIVAAGYTFTTATGFSISKKLMHAEKTDISVSKPLPNHAAPPRDTGTPRPSKRKLLRGRSQSQLQQLREDRPYVPDILHTEEGDTATKPLLLEDSLKGFNYSTISVNSSTLQTIPDAPEPEISTRKTTPRTLYQTTSFDSTSRVEPTFDENLQTDGRPEQVSELADTSNVLNEQQPHDNGGISALIAAIKQSYSMSLSVMQSPLGEFHSRKLELLKEQENTKIKKSKPSFSKRLIILCVSTFFTAGSSLGFIIYVSNTLTIGIFHGDPTSPPGTEGYELYERGLRTAALGNLALYASYMTVSLNNTKIIDIIGEKVQFVLCHAVLAVSLLALILTQRVEVYFVFMVFCGAFRTCAFTLPFVLANKFTQDEIQKNSDDQKSSRNVGKVMSLIGLLMPTHFIIMSTFMGPLMDATGNVWAPLIYSLCSCTISLAIFTSLFFVKS